MTDIELIRNVLGLDTAEAPFRRHIAPVTGSDTQLQCADLVTQGLMVAAPSKNPEQSMYLVTIAGADLVGSHLPE